MRKIIFLFLVINFISLYGNILNSQTHWIWQNPMPSGEELGRAYFLNANTCWVPSAYGRISKTTNGGLNWIDQSWQNNKSVSGIYFINSRTGWAAGANGLVLKSTNGGTNWTQQISNTTGNLICVKFINSLTGWIGGEWNNFLRTTNGGSNWIFSNQVGDEIYSLYFVNSLTGWLSCSNGHIQKTIDGGISFTGKNVPSFYNHDIYFVNENTGWFAGEGTNPTGGDGIYKTTDAGDNWIPYVVPTSDCCYRSLFFKDVNTGWVSTITGRIYKTTNGGINWSNPIYPGGLRLNFLYFADTITGFVGGGADAMYSVPMMSKTTNGGLNWISLVTGQNYIINSVSVINSRNAFAAGIYNCLAKTSNGGNGWEFKSNNWGILNSVFFVNVNTGWTAGWTSNGVYSTLIKTTNAGASWINQDSSMYCGYLGLFFLNSNLGWSVGYHIIKMTTNGGTNWQKLSGYDTINTYNAIQFLNTNTGWAVYEYSNSGGGILKTTNSGINWFSQFSSTTGIKTFHFLNLNTGYANAGITGILKTTNGGNNWDVINNTITGIKSMYFVNANTGWLVGYTGSAGLIVKTTNGGTNFDVLPTMTSNSLNCVRFSGINVGWIVGDNGVILKTTTGGITFEQESTVDIPANFKLFQNYPNPFNPNTIIRFQIKDSRFVKLKIYDILGKEISTLVNEKMQPGTYEVKFDGSRLASGVYFYKLQAGDFQETKKYL
jgi:photosystem II stability/assembly factor-like uncharacterized protein